MKASNRLEQKKIIEEWKVTDTSATLIRVLTEIKQNIDDFDNSICPIELFEVGESIIKTVAELNNLEGKIDILTQYTNQTTVKRDKTMLGISTDRYNERKDWINLDEIERIRERNLFSADNEHAVLFDNLIKKHASWKFPSVYVRPNNLRFFDSLKASDVLYAMEQCDVRPYLFRNLSPKEFKIIRFKFIDENKDLLLSELPQEQIGLIVMEDFLNYKPIELLKRYLKESFEVLRDGGVLLFTFNNCDLSSGARSFEHGLYYYTPGYMIRDYCNRLGFITESETVDNRISYMCVHKPGDLKTLKGGKTLGKITKEVDN